MTARYDCTVGVPDMPDYILLELKANTQGCFVACSTQVYVTDDTAKVTEVFNSALIAGGNGGGGAAVIKPATGETVIPLTASELTIRHATWFDNAEQTAITVLPAAWKNEVMTCYLKSAVPVGLSGVTWIYGEPTMAAGYIFVIALQQIDATAVLANLAYVLPQ